MHKRRVSKLLSASPLLGCILALVMGVRAPAARACQCQPQEGPSLVHPLAGSTGLPTDAGLEISLGSDGRSIEALVGPEGERIELVRARDVAPASNCSGP